MKRWKRFSFLVFVFVGSATIMAGSALGYIGVKFYASQNQGADGGSGLSLRYSVADLARDTDIIVVGKVRERHDGLVGSDSWIYNENIVDIERYLKNPQAANEIAIKEPVGAVGDLQPILGDVHARFTVGERVLLFVTTSPRGNFVYNANNGKFVIDTGGNALGSAGEKKSLVELERIIEAHKNDKKAASPCDPNFVAQEGFVNPLSVEDCAKLKSK